MEKLYQMIKHYMGIHMLASNAKRELAAIVIKIGKSVNAYYHKLFKLWERAKTPEDERMTKFTKTVKPWVSQPLLAIKYNTMIDLLDAAQIVESKKQSISNNHPRDAAKPAQKPNWQQNSPKPSASTSSPTGMAAENAPRQETGVNAKLVPTSSKPTEWVGTWYKSKQRPPTLQGDDKRLALAPDGRCFLCRGSGHRASDNGCCNFVKRLDVGRVKKVASDTEKA